MLKITIWTTSILATLGRILIFIRFYSLFDFLIFGLFWSGSTWILVFSTQNCLVVYLYYFYFVCYYFKLKLRRKNLILKLAVKNLNRKFRITEFMFRLNKIYISINEFNNEFWMKFLSINLTFYLTGISGLFYSSFFGIVHYSLPIFFVFNVSIFLTLIISTASMSLEANKSLLMSHKIYLCTNQNINTKLKVIACQTY